MPYLFLVKSLLSPVLFLQGRRTQRTALRLPEPQGQRHGCVLREGCDRTIHLLFVGDSTMAGVGVAHQDAALAAQTSAALSMLSSCSVHWQLIAKSGVRTGQILSLAEREKVLRADVLITATGGNDVLAQTKPNRFLRAYEKLIGALLPPGEARLTVISGLPPLHITPAVPQPLRWFLGLYARHLDRRLRCWVQTQPQVAYLSLQWAADRTRLAIDRFHPGEALYREWSDRIAQQIAKHLAGGRLTEAVPR